MSSADTEILRAGLAYGEGLRWRDGNVWYSDMHGGTVHRLSLEGEDRTVVDVPGKPSGLGWLPDGSMLVVSMHDRTIRRWDGRDLHLHADLSARLPYLANDMVVDQVGRAFVGSFGLDLDAYVHEHGFGALFRELGPPTAPVLVVGPDGSVLGEAAGLRFPNGSVILDGGHTLVVAETLACRLTAFDITPDGGLSGRRTWADLGSQRISPDGIAVGADGGIWVASPLTSECLLIGEGGEQRSAVRTTQPAVCCVVAGDVLVIATVPSLEPDPRRRGLIEVASLPR